MTPAQQSWLRTTPLPLRTVSLQSFDDASRIMWEQV